MKTKTDILLELWLEARTRFSNQLERLSEEDLLKKLNNSPNYVGFLIRENNITTKEFGTKTKAESFGRIISHTAYRAGQWTIINKYGII